MEIQRATEQDLSDILKLQYLAYQSEAILVNNFKIQPLTQTFEEITEEFKQGVFYKSVDKNGKIIGSVRGIIKDKTLYIGKLMVNPDKQGQGLGTALLQHIEKENKDLRKELFTSDLSEKNIKLYERNGYHKFMVKPVSESLNLVFLEK